MTKANISQLKAQLSKYIHLVKRGGEVIILDRDQPVAILSAVKHKSDQITLVPARRDGKIFFDKLKKRDYTQKSDILDILIADREDRF